MSETEVNSLLAELAEQAAQERAADYIAALEEEERLAYEDMMQRYAADSYNDDMDGDAASALASAGWGTDEDYVMDNDYLDDY